MSIRNATDRGRWSDRQRLHEEALIEAEALRHQAIDDFWRGAGQLLASATARAVRAGVRLGAAWTRRGRAGAGS